MSNGDLKILHTNPRFQLEDTILLNRAEACYPKLRATFDVWRKQIPLPTRIRDASVGRWRRFPESYRSITWLTEPENQCSGSVIIKGSEPAMTDFDDLVRWTSRTAFRVDNTHGHMPMADHLALREHKIPGAMTLREALTEARIALELQQRHIAAYGELLALPLPLLIHEHDVETTTRVMACARQHLAPLAYERLHPLFEGGLAAYVYFYPGAPLRVRTHCGAHSGETEFQRVERLSALGHQDSIEHWLRIVARLLHLGYMPYSYQNEGLGACFDPGNACMDGGFVDVDSIVPLEALGDDGVFYDALVATVLGLTRTALYLLPSVSHGETSEFFVRNYVLQRLGHLLETEARPSLELDRRLMPLRGALDLPTLNRVLSSRNRDPFDFLDARRVGVAQ